MIELDYIAEQVEAISDLIEQGYEEPLHDQVAGYVLKASELLEEVLEALREYKDERDSEDEDDPRYRYALELSKQVIF